MRWISRSFKSGVVNPNKKEWLQVEMKSPVMRILVTITCRGTFPFMSSVLLFPRQLSNKEFLHNLAMWAARNGFVIFAQNSSLSIDLRLFRIYINDDRKIQRISITHCAIKMPWEFQVILFLGLSINAPSDVNIIRDGRKESMQTEKTPQSTEVLSLASRTTDSPWLFSQMNSLR